MEYKFKLKGEAHDVWPVKVYREVTNGTRTEKVLKKEHIKGGTIFTTMDVKIPFEELKKQLGAIIIWSEPIPGTEEKNE